MLVGFRPAEVEGGLAMAGITVQWREITRAVADQEWRILRQSVAPFAAVPRGSASVLER